MGRLVKLELENFKSYAGKQIVGPFDNFTCIVGPNGSGKSNMMDAISFVLGVSARHLRGANLKELIYRKGVDDPPARRASVSLFYVLEEGEVNGFPGGTEIKFSRILSSAGVSSYKLEDKDVTFDLYEQMLRKIGVLVKARNFLVFQGDVEAVASKSPTEISKLIEQISGSDEYKIEYDELLLRKDDAEETTLLMLQKKKMYAAQCKELKAQRDEAEFFQEKRAEANKLKTERTLLVVWKTTLVIDENQRSVTKFKSILDEVGTREAALDEEIQSSKKELAKRHKTQTATEKEMSVKAKAIQTLELELNGVEAKVKNFNKRMVECADSEKRLQTDVKQQTENKKKFEKQIADLKKEYARIESELNKKAADSGLLLDPENLKEYSRLREVLAGRTATWRSEELNLEQELTSKEQRVSRLDLQVRSIKHESDSEIKMISEYEDRFSRLTAAIADGNKELAETNAERAAKLEDMKSNKALAEEYSKELDDVNTKISEAGDEIRRSKHEDKMNEAITSMKRIFPGVHGKLVDICRPIQRKYGQAVIVAAGKSMDSIVVDSKQVAIECMAYLRDQRIGICTFLPLNNLTLLPISDRYRTLGENYKLCVDLIECDDIFKSAVQYAIGDTIVCETLEDAQALCFRGPQDGGFIKAVTVRGHIISKSGAMTGGSFTGPRDGAGSRNRWEEKDFEKLRQRKTELDGLMLGLKQSAQFRQALIDLETRYKTLQNRIQYSEADLKVAREKLSYLQQQKDLKVDSIKSIESDIAQLKKDIALINTNLAKAKDSIRSVESDVFSAFSATVGVSNIREYEESKVKVHDNLLQRRLVISEQLSALNSQLEYENKRDFDGPLQRIKSQGLQLADSIKEQNGLELSCRKNEASIRKEIEEIAKKLAKTKSETSDISAAFKTLQSKKTKLNAERDSALSSISGEEILIEKGRAELHEILQKAQVDEVTLPTVPVLRRNLSNALSSSELSSTPSSLEDESRRFDVNESDLIWTGAQTSESEPEPNQRRTITRRTITTTTSASASGGGGGGEGSNDMETSEEEVSDTTGTSRSATTIHYSQSGDSAVVRDRAQAQKVNLASMEKYKKLPSARIEELEASLVKGIHDISQELENVNPNMHAFERYAHLLEISNECELKVEEARQTSKSVLTRFEQVKRFRCEAFQDCYRHVSEALAVVYRDLTRSSKHPLGGNAYLTLDNTDEPYLGGTRFTAMPPMKRFRDIDQLSGGEKTMAALALLFSIHSFRQAPFFVLDEVDAALDNVNVKKVCNYIQQRSKDFQCIVISLKDMFFEHADCLVGICKDVPSLSGRIITLNLKKYAAAGPQQEEGMSSQQSGTGGGGRGGGVGHGESPSHQGRRSSSSSLQRTSINNLDDYDESNNGRKYYEHERDDDMSVASTGVMSVDPAELIVTEEATSVKKVYKITSMPPPAIPPPPRHSSSSSSSSSSLSMPSKSTSKSGGGGGGTRAVAVSSPLVSKTQRSSSSSAAVATSAKAATIAGTAEQLPVRKSSRQRTSSAADTTTGASSFEEKEFSQ